MITSVMGVPGLADLCHNSQANALYRTRGFIQSTNVQFPHETWHMPVKQIYSLFISYWKQTLMLNLSAGRVLFGALQAEK